MKATRQTIVRDLSWLAFNARVLQEAKDPSVPLIERLRFLGIFSNNLDEFFRVRVATLSRMVRLGKAAKVHLEANPGKILKEIQQEVMLQQTEFDQVYDMIISELEKQRIFIKNDTELTVAQQTFISHYFDEQVRTQIVPLMIESIPVMPLLNDKAIYLACVLSSSTDASLQRYALIPIPTKVLPRFVLLPSEGGEKDLILLEDIIRFSLPQLFAAFGFNRYQGHIIKVTRDAELEIDASELSGNIITELEKGLKNRKRGRATRFVFDRNIDAQLLDYLVKRLSLTGKDNLIPGGRIHNFKDFMNFPEAIFPQPEITHRNKPFVHPLLLQPRRLMKVLDRRDVMLHLPYHSFDSVLDLLRESAIDPFVQSIKITCYRLAKDSKLINALINAVRNGKQVTVVLELRARFDEEANLMWKTRLEEEGVLVILGLPEYKVHAKICLIKKREMGKTKLYGFISTGNFNENTARYYGDHCLLTANRKILNEVAHVFSFLEQAHPKVDSLKTCRILAIAPYNMREVFAELIAREIRAARKKKTGSIIIKLNSIADSLMINQLYDAASAGVKVSLVIRGICGVYTQQRSFKQPMKAVSIIDEYLEHARVFIFHTAGKPKVYISSADWMVRNLDHRVEVACPIFDHRLQQELLDIMNIQLAENVKGRVLDNEQRNEYVYRDESTPQLRSQVAIYDYLAAKEYED